MALNAVYISLSPSNTEALRAIDPENISVLNTITEYNEGTAKILKMTQPGDAEAINAMRTAYEKLLNSYGVDKTSHTQKQADLITALNWLQNPNGNEFNLAIKNEDLKWLEACFLNSECSYYLYEDDDNYYQFVLNFTDGDALTPEEKSDLTLFVKEITARCDGNTDVDTIGEKFGPDMLTLYKFANEYIAAHTKPIPTGTISDLTHQKVFSGADDTVSELPNSLLAWLPATKALSDAMGADEYQRFITDDVNLGWSDYGYYNDSWLGTDDTTVVTLDELKELAGESKDRLLNYHLGDKQPAVNAAATGLLEYLSGLCVLSEFTYTAADRNTFDVRILRESNSNLTVQMKARDGKTCIFHAKANSPILADDILYFDNAGEKIDDQDFPVEALLKIFRNDP